MTSQAIALELPIAYEVAILTDQLPIPYTVGNVPLYAKSNIADFTNDKVPELAQKIADFYAQFLSQQNRQNLEKTLSFSDHKPPNQYPSEVNVEKFKRKFIALIQEDFNQDFKKWGYWSKSFSTRDFPEGLLKNACEELESDFQCNLGQFFPTRSCLSIKVVQTSLVVSWHGEGGYFQKGNAS